MKEGFTSKQIIKAAKEVGISKENIENLIKILRESDEPKVFLKDIGLKSRTYNALKRKGMETEEDLRCYIEIYGIRTIKFFYNFGEVSYQDLQYTHNHYKNKLYLLYSQVILIKHILLYYLLKIKYSFLVFSYTFLFLYLKED